MARISEQWTRPKRPSANFPPYELADESIVAVAREKTRKLERIYHVGHKQAWDGREVLSGLVEKHGGIDVPDDKREALGKICSVLLWGELAAWSISADIALRLEDPDAKMAASSQVFDEARHFYVLRDYLWQAGIKLPPLGGYSRRVLIEVLDTESLLHKLVGMQLMVENTAVALFKGIARAQIEPVLTELVYYYERDEARHVGLGAIALPQILPDLGPVEAARLWWFQTRMALLMMAGGLTMREEFAALGVDQSAMQRHHFDIHAEVLKQMKAAAASPAGGSRENKGVFRLSRAGQTRINEFLFPKEPEAERSPLHTLTLNALIAGAKAGDRLFA